MKWLSRSSILGVALLLLVGCSSPKTAEASSTTAGDAGTTTTTTGTTTLANPDTKMTNQQPKPKAAQGDVSATAAPGASAPKAGDEVAVIETNYGRIVFKFFPDKAPKHVANFKKLATSNFYDGTKFHRVIPRFMIQGGDPNSKGKDRSTYGMGGPKEHVQAEFNDIHHDRGIVSMARSGDPNSAGSQFFIMVAPNSGLDGQYSAFGQVVEGMDTVDKIVNLPRDERDDPNPGSEAVMKSVRIEKWPIKNK
jgi:peptidyl-prolyl cis-trans isomerase B (cyclophilin B)